MCYRIRNYLVQGGGREGGEGVVEADGRVRQIKDTDGREREIPRFPQRASKKQTSEEGFRETNWLLGVKQTNQPYTLSPLFIKEKLFVTHFV